MKNKKRCSIGLPPVGNTGHSQGGRGRVHGLNCSIGEEREGREGH